MTTDTFCFYLQNRLIQTSQTGGQLYSDTSPFSIPCLSIESCISVKKLILNAYIAEQAQHGKHACCWPKMIMLHFGNPVNVSYGNYMH